jgi:hypothetical protein
MTQLEPRLALALSQLQARVTATLVKLETLVHFGGCSKFNSGPDKRSGLGDGDSNGIVGVLVPGVG